MTEQLTIKTKTNRLIQKELLAQLCAAAAVQEIPTGKVKKITQVGNELIVIVGTMSSHALGWICCWGHTAILLDKYKGKVPAMSYWEHGKAVDDKTAERGYEGIIVSHKGENYVLAGKRITFKDEMLYSCDNCGTEIERPENFCTDQCKRAHELNQQHITESKHTAAPSTKTQRKSYPGNKAIQGIAQKIINEIPRCDVFRELFAGSAAVSSIITVPDPAIHINEKSEKVFQDLRFTFPSSIVTNDCAISIIENLPRNPTRKEVIFLDPPYRFHTRPNSQNIYDHEMTDADHIQLLSAVLAKEQNYCFLIIHPDDEMYNAQLQHWRKVPIKVRYRNKTSNEVLYMNYPAPDKLQDYKFLGNGCHDRQRIKRKGDRLIAKLMELPAVEKNYILERLKGMY